MDEIHNFADVFSQNKSRNSSNTTDTAVVFPIRPWLLSCYAFLAVAGIVGNSMVLFVLARNRYMRRSALGVYIGGLAIADLFVALSGVPTYLLSTGSFINHPTGIAGNIMCKTFTGYAIMFYSAAVSVYVLLAITVERYLVICKPQSVLAVSSAGRAKAVIGVIWVWTLLVSLNPIIGEEYSEPHEAQVGAHCKFSLTYHRKMTPKVIYGVIFTVKYILPISLMTFCFVKIRRELLQQNKNLLNTRGNIDSEVLRRQLKIRERTVNAIIYVIVTYFVLWTPNQSLYFCYNFDLLNLPWDSNWVQGSLILYFVTCCVNPIIYALRSKMFRSGFIATFKCIYCLNKETNAFDYSSLSDDDPNNANDG